MKEFIRKFINSFSKWLIIKDIRIIIFFVSILMIPAIASSITLILSNSRFNSLIVLLIVSAFEFILFFLVIKKTAEITDYKKVKK